MIPLQSRQRLLDPSLIQPSDPRLAVIGVFNPGAILYNDEIVLLVRVAEGTSEQREGFFSSPRYRNYNGEWQLDIEWFQPDPRSHDPRKPLIAGGKRRLSFISHLEIVRLARDGVTVRSIEKHPQLFCQTEWEVFGIEDPRITIINDIYFITYVAVSPSMGICTALMSTRDFRSFQRHGIIFPTDNKDVVVTWHEATQRYIAFHRPLGKVPIADAAVWFADSPNLLHWGNHQIAFSPRKEVAWESGKIGMGTPLLETEDGLLALYHSVAYRDQEDEVGTYVASAILFNKNLPSKVVARANSPLMTPEAEFEEEGFVQNVVFPTGVVQIPQSEAIFLYYGAADTSVAVARTSLRDIVATLAS